VVPSIRPGIVSRRGLNELFDAHDCPIVAVVAPPGYGKSTLLAQWAQGRQPRVGWLSVDAWDNDPAVLLTYLATALTRIEAVDPPLTGRMPPGAGIADVSRLIAAIESMSQPVTLVLDQVEELTSRPARDVVAELAVRIPAGSRLAIGSRHALPIPLARLRGQRAVVEIGVDELRMDRADAAQLLASAGVVVPDATADELNERTEGWPVGLYLAALALGAGRRAVPPTATFTGDDRFIADYLRSELLDGRSRSDVAFLSRTSILERMSGPLCDAVLQRSGSAATLDQLERHNLLVMPLDRRREWYRYHHLLRELLEVELRANEPELVAGLHARAAAWFEAHDQPDAAIAHAQRSGDAEHVARLVLRYANPVWASGRVDTVLGWMAWFADNGLIERFAAVAVHGTLIHALTGDAGSAERWAAAAERATSHDPPPDGNTMAGSLAYLRALLCRDGLDVMRDDAVAALAGLAPTSPYRPAMLHAQGAAFLLQGDADAADAWFVRAVNEANAAALSPFVPVALAERGLIAVARGDWDDALALCDEALSLMDGGRFDDYWTSALVFAWGARMRCRSGDLDGGRELAARAARLRPLLTYTLPIVSAQALVELARAYIALGDQHGGRVVLRQLNDVLAQRPRLGTIVTQAEDLRGRLDTMKSTSFGASALTTAELRILPFLSTHLTMNEIAERLYLSRNTVKTQVISIYRKLGVSSRGQAVDQIAGLGLVNGA